MINKLVREMVSQLKAVVSGRRFEPVGSIESSKLEYPLPCSFCNMICQDEGYEMYTLHDAGVVRFDGKTIEQLRHVSGCPIGG